MAKKAGRRLSRADEKRFASLLVLFIGRLGLIFSLVFLGTSHWFGVPNTTTPLRLILFGILGLILAMAGYRLASGTRDGFSQVLYQSAAIAGVLFLAACLRNELNAHRLPSPPAWAIVIAALAPVSWWIFARKKNGLRPKKRLNESSISTKP